MSNEKLEPGHQRLDAQLGPAGALRKLEREDLKKQVTDHFGDRELGELMAREAILLPDGSIDLPATLFKIKRRRLIKTLPMWAGVGLSEKAPRGSGPMPRQPEDVPIGGPDQGNAQVVATPISVMTSDGSIFTPTDGRPDLAIEILRDIIRRTRRAQGLD